LSPNPKQSPIIESSALKIAIRVYPLTAVDADSDKARKRKRWHLPGEMLVFDTESRIDPAQCLTFGGYRCIIDGECVEEGYFHGDALSPKEVATLKRYVAQHRPIGAVQGSTRLRLLTLREFLDDLIYKDFYKARCLLVAFNHPFDLSRIACDVVPARLRFAGGFSLGLWTYKDKNGVVGRHRYRPRVAIKHIDSKRALIGFTGRLEPDEEDLIPEGSRTGKPEEDYIFRGHFLDLRTLAYALTDSGHSLESACDEFHVEHPKKPATEHGRVTKKYIAYNRRDVLATTELATKLLEEYGKHGITTQVTKIFSPASIGKGYLRDMGIRPVLKRQPDFPKRYLGYAQSAFYGGRTSAHIRKAPVPVVYTDFLSMYPTVNSLIGLWWFVVAKKIRVIEGCADEIRSFLDNLTAEDLFKPETWKKFPAFVRIIPQDDLLPCRSKYNAESNDWQVAVNYLSASNDERENALWYSLPDVIASKLLTGRTPHIVDAFRIEPGGVARGLQPAKLRGAITVDPRTQDFFKVVIEQRKLSAARKDLNQTEKKRLDKALKVLANAASYGIYGEMHRKESEKKERILCQGIDPEPYSCSVLHPETPGEYCFPPFASLITGAARLMLALLEYSVWELGGTYAMEDTDSMAVVATENGGLIPCKGGKERTQNGEEAIRALSWKEVEDISTRFLSLNPYDKNAIRRSILKIEDDNYIPGTTKLRQIYCLAISAKRYALFRKDTEGFPILLRKTKFREKRKEKDFGEDRWSEHGLGHLLNPIDPENEDREWIAQTWDNIVRQALGFHTNSLGFEDRPAVGRISVSSPAIMRSMERLNRNKKYGDQIKPFNFLISCHVKAFGHPVGTNPERFHLIAPYDKNSKEWLRKEWIDEYSGNIYRIRTWGKHGDRNTARVKNYGEILEEYEFHPESKCADADGNPCDKQTIGLLQRRHVRIGELKCIGKESNSLENVEAGLEHSEKNVYTDYVDPKRDEWATKILPALRKASLKLLVKKCKGQVSRRAIIDLRAGRSRPHRKTRDLLVAILKNLGQSS
jgi:hypothetical protein